MAWSERQQTMLRAMGLRLWLPPSAAGPADAVSGGEGRDSASPVPDDAAAAASVAASPAATPVTLTARTVPPAEDRAPAPRRHAVPQVAATADAAPATTSLRPPADGTPDAPPASRPTPSPSTVARPGRTTTPAPATTALAAVPLTGIANDWDGLQAQVAACTACGLCEGRRQTVFGVGDRRARLMIIGEAPGEQEDRQGEPFVGAAGQLLDRMLEAVGHRRGEGDLPRVYIANTLKCRPPGNRNPTPEELARCTPYLYRQIALLRPRLILALGAFAVRAVLRMEAPIGRLRGQVHAAAWPGEPGPEAPTQLPVVVSYHPSYLLRQPTEKAKAWADLCLAMDTLQRLDGERPGAA